MGSTSQISVPCETRESRAGSDSDSTSTSWHFAKDEHVYESVVNEWLRQDILDGRLFFRHTDLTVPAQ